MATTRILIVGDTHVYTWEEVHPAIREAVAEADIAIHCGDIVRMAVVEGFRETAKRSFVVAGNSDPPYLWKALPTHEIFEVDGLHIGVTHPIWGQEEFEPPRLLPDFVEDGEHTADVICYGHLHVPVIATYEGVLFVNGGQGYPSFLVPGTVAWLTIEDGVASAEIVEFAPAE
ncbi:MAG TPA: metallophosphoesterase family protein [Dehalococcoidia bacterium]|nr:metallophosphoesterase family protein [Dehalococcoidia bacterium]